MKVEEVRRQSDICRNYYLFNIQLNVKQNTDLYLSL